MKIDQLNEAFQNFSAASKSLETYYGALKERIAYLTNELEIRNQQLKEALGDAERNKDYLKAILHNLEEAIIAVDPEGRVTTMNRSAEELLGTSSTEAAGMPFNALSFSLTTENAATQLLAGGRKYSVILSQSDVIDSEGSLRGRVILIKDITRLRELELRHERNQRLIAMGEMSASSCTKSGTRSAVLSCSRPCSRGTSRRRRTRTWPAGSQRASVVSTQF